MRQNVSCFIFVDKFPNAAINGKILLKINIIIGDLRHFDTFSFMN